MATANLPKFGKIKMNGVWNNFHESNVITGTISDDYCKFKIEEFKPKMNKYKIIESNGGLLIDVAPDYQKFMESGIEIESYSKHEAVCSIYDNSPNTWRQCYVLDTDTLKLFLVYWYRDSMDRMTTTESFHSILEKPLMKKYKIIPNQNKHPDSITYEFMESYFTVESDSPVNSFQKYCEKDSFVLNLDSNFGYVFDTESLDLYYTSWSINEQIGHFSFVKKLEKPVEKLKMNKYKILLDLDDPNPSFEKMMASKYSIEAASPKNAFVGHRTINPRWARALILDTETLDLYRVSFSTTPRREITTDFIKKLEKPTLKMNKYKLASKYSHLKNSTEIIEAENWTTAAINYYNNGNFVFGITNSCNIYVLNIETLTVYKVFLKKEITGKISTWSDEFKSETEKPMTKPKLNTLSFKTLTEANNQRLPLFKNSKGLPAHSKPDGSDWSHAEWLQAVIGELGEYANIMKKVQRGDLTMEEAKPSIEKELADVMTYFSILAQQLNIDLGQAVEDKFNEVSRRVECDVFIENDKVVRKSQDSLTWKGDEKFKAVFVNHDKDGKCAEKLYAQYWAKLADSKIENDSLVSVKEKLKVIKLIKVKSLLTNNVRYFYNSSSNFKNELQSVPKSILLNHKPYEYSPDCIKVNDLLQFIFDDYSTLSYVVTEITYEEDEMTKSESINKDKEKTLQKVMNQHKVRPDAWINNQDYATSAMIVGLAHMLIPLFIKKPTQKTITLQDLNNGKIYTRPFISGHDSTTLQEFSKLVVTDATVMKTLQNGKDYDGFNVNVGDMIQFSDDRNVLYSLRVTKIE